MTKYQTFWPRFLAGVVDGLVFIPVSVIDVFLVSADRSPWILVGWTIISYPAYWLYSVLMHARFGQTLGKMALRVKVLDISEKRIPTLRQAFLRDSPYIVLSTFAMAAFIHLVLTGQYWPAEAVVTTPEATLYWASLGWFLLEVLSMATNGKRRAVHDFLAGTVVVRCSF